MQPIRVFSILFNNVSDKSISFCNKFNILSFT